MKRRENIWLQLYVRTMEAILHKSLRLILIDWYKLKWKFFWKAYYEKSAVIIPILLKWAFDSIEYKQVEYEIQRFLK